MADVKRLSRIKEKTRKRDQAARTCSESLATLELPSMEDPLVQQLEARLAERGRALKERVAMAAQILARP